MKKSNILYAAFLLALSLSAYNAHAQQGFGTASPNKASVIDMSSSSKGLLIPRVALTSTGVFAPVKGAASNTANSLMVYNTNTAGDVTPGYYYWLQPTTAAGKWVRLATNADMNALTLNGDVTGPFGSNKVVKIQNVPVSATAPTTNQFLRFDGTNWTPSTITTTNTLVNSGTNTLTSTVNSVVSSASIVNTVANSLSGTNLTTTVNGVSNSTALDLTPAITAAQKTTTVVSGTNTSVTPTAPAAIGNTQYTVNVPTANGTTLGVVKEAATNPSVAINANGELSVNLANVTGKGNLTSSTGDNSITVTNGTGTTFVNTDIKVSDSGITTAKIANNAVTIAKLPIGATNTTFLRGDGTWVTPTDNNTTYLGSTSVILNSNSFERAALTGDVTAPANSNVTTIADNAINSNKITNGSIQAEDLNTNIAGNGLAISGNALQVNAQNGINVNNDLVKLGGALTESTTITQSSYPLTIATGGTALTISGLPTGVTADKALVATSTGVVKQVRQAPRFFYMPAVIFDTSANGTNLTRNLYDEYVKQFQGGQAGAGNATYNIAHGTAGYSMPYNGGIVGSTGAPADIPVYTSGELYYYITYYDTAVFSNLSINASGELTYSIISNASNVSYMNIVFVVKE